MIDSLPRETVKTLAVLLIFFFDSALERGRAALERIQPLLEPPDDLRVSSPNGTLYSGIVALDRGEVIAGIVVATGYDPLRAATSRPSALATPFTSSSQLATRESSGRLPSWADVSRDDEDDEDGRSPWRR